MPSLTTITTGKINYFQKSNKKEFYIREQKREIKKSTNVHENRIKKMNKKKEIIFLFVFVTN